MRRQENQPPRPTAGFLSIPLFNQKKRNRVPLTSSPSENDFFSHCELMASSSSETSHCTSDTYGCYQASGPSSAAPQSNPWTAQTIPSSAPSQQYGSNRPAPGPAPAMRRYAPISYPYKAGGAGSKMGQTSNSVKQQESSFSVNSRKSNYEAPCSSDDAQSESTSLTGFSQVGQESFNRPPNPTHSQQSRPLPARVTTHRPSAHAVQTQKHTWKFTNSFGPQRPLFEGKRATKRPQTSQRTYVQERTKPAIENSLRILTAVIDGMRHWSQFKNKVPYLFEIFATLDSAVTLGHHGAKNFLLRDGKKAVQCVFYENEQQLPRLIRGQVHRCVGNYDRSRDVLVCVSVRPGLPSELRNAEGAVKACDAEMRALVKSLSEV